MIYWIDGSLEEINETDIIIQTKGIGYQVYFPTRYHQQLPSLKSQLKVYIYHHIREDIEQLYGFLTTSDKTIFCQLISISGIGPKLALKILSSIQTIQLIQTIENKDAVSLTRIPGVGKKMAERMIIELNGKLPNTIDGKVIKPEGSAQIQNTILELTNDLSLALRSLGYNTSEVKLAIKKSHPEITSNTTIEQGIKVALKYL